MIKCQFWNNKNWCTGIPYQIGNREGFSGAGIVYNIEHIGAKAILMSFYMIFREILTALWHTYVAFFKKMPPK